LPLHMHEALFAIGQWLYRWCLEKYGLLCNVS